VPSPASHLISRPGIKLHHHFVIIHAAFFRLDESEDEEAPEPDEMDREDDDSTLRL
jgi:hypothetical protein